MFFYSRYQLPWYGHLLNFIVVVGALALGSMLGEHYLFAPKHPGIIDWYRASAMSLFGSVGMIISITLNALLFRNANKA